MSNKRKIKNTKIHLYEVMHYENIRSFIKALLFSPSMNKQSMQEAGIITSQRTFYDRLQNITFYMEDNIYEYKINRTKYKNILNDLYMCPANYFADTYMYASYNEEDLFYYIIYMQIIDKMLQESGYADTIFCFNDILYYWPKSLNTKIKPKRDKFLELEKIGIIEYVHKSDRYNKLHYKLSDDILNYSENNFLDNLLDMVIFFYNHHYLSIPGYYLSKTINQYKILNQNTKNKEHYQPENNLFVYRYVPKYNTLDNNILWDILQAIQNNHKISYTYTMQNGSSIKYNLIPIKIVIEYDYGKQYCYGYDDAAGKYFLSRIDMMDNIEISEEKYENEDIYLNFDKDFINKWAIADNTGSYHIRIYFHFPAEKYKILKRQLENTMRFGKIVENNEGTITFDITISNYKEIIPWVNSFGEYAIVDKNICPELYNDIKLHNDKLREIYGII